MPISGGDIFVVGDAPMSIDASLPECPQPAQPEPTPAEPQICWTTQTKSPHSGDIYENVHCGMPLVDDSLKCADPGNQLLVMENVDGLSRTACAPADRVEVKRPPYDNVIRGPMDVDFMHIPTEDFMGSIHYSDSVKERVADLGVLVKTRIMSSRPIATVMVFDPELESLYTVNVKIPSDEPVTLYYNERGFAVRTEPAAPAIEDAISALLDRISSERSSAAEAASVFPTDSIDANMILLSSIEKYLEPITKA